MPRRRSRSRRICATSATRRGSWRRQPPAFGGLDLLVNCAGATKRGDFFALSHEDFLDGFALKFHGAVAMTRAAWPRLRESGAGHVVNIIGAAARTPSADFAIGGAVNSALENFTKAMADRGRAEKVRARASASSTSTRRTG